MQSFETSKKKKTTTIQDGDDGRGGTQIKVEESAGDASFLNVAKNALVEQARLLGLHELKREEQQDKTYQQFLKDLTVTIDKEKQLKEADDLRANALPVQAGDVSDATTVLPSIESL